MKRPTAQTCEFCQSVVVKPLTVTVEAMCEMIGCGRSFAYDLIRKREVEKVELGPKKTVVTVSSIEAMIARNTVKTDPAPPLDGAQASKGGAPHNSEVARSRHVPRRTGATARQP